MPDLIAQLRTETSALHQALHIHPLLAPLQEATIEHQDYIWCIRAFHSAYKCMEHAVTMKSTLPVIPVLQWLEKDRQIHHIDPIELLSMHYSTIDNYSKLIGYHYVKQGSTLGGRVISKHLHKNLGLIEGDTNYFFAGLGDETGALWKQFLPYLDDTSIDAHEAVTQAVQTFSFINQCCDAALHIKNAN